MSSVQWIGNTVSETSQLRRITQMGHRMVTPCALFRSKPLILSLECLLQMLSDIFNRVSLCLHSRRLEYIDEKVGITLGSQPGKNFL
jgi:hypothetical protein